MLFKPYSKGYINMKQNVLLQAFKFWYFYYSEISFNSRMLMIINC